MLQSLNCRIALHSARLAGSLCELLGTCNATMSQATTGVLQVFGIKTSRSHAFNETL